MEITWLGHGTFQFRGQEKGIEPDWDIRPVLKEIAAHAQRMVPVLEQIDAREW
jgi:hypothetical protein